MSDDIYNEIIAYDPEIHPRNPKEYPGKRVKNTEDFITKAQWVHGVGRFDYSEVVYTKASEKVLITCHAEGHGSWSFEQRPADHTNKANGCAKCSGKYRWTTEEWLENIKKIWGDEFDYEGVVYKGAFDRITVTHNKCGHSFKVTPDNHARGKGCPKCKKTKPPKYTTEDFINEVKDVHGDRFDLSLVVYKNSITPVKVRCIEHDNWTECLPVTLLSPTSTVNCFDCQGRIPFDPNKKKYVPRSKEDWIKGAREVHGDRYDYSFLEDPALRKQTIYCPEHDRYFSHTYTEHVTGKMRCKRCFDDTMRMTQEDYITACKKKHKGMDYDYSKVEYKGWGDTVTIHCNIHAHDLTRRAWDFAFSKTHEAGCRYCAGLSKTNEQFIEEAKRVHGDKFSYDATEYIGSSVKVKLYCKIHEEYFEQLPNAHLNSIFACPKCYIENATTWYSSHTLPESMHDIESTVYHVEIENYNTGRVFNKVGITTKDVDTRFKGCHLDGFSIKSLQEIHTTLVKSLMIEEHLLECLRERNLLYKVHDLKGTRIAGWTECYVPTTNFVYDFFDTFEE